MSKKLFFGSNLKMYKNIKDTVSYLQELESLTKDISRDEIELFIIPSYTTLDSASKAIDQKDVYKRQGYASAILLYPSP